jgi:hypothetical protein
MLHLHPLAFSSELTLRLAILPPVLKDGSFQLTMILQLILIF